VSLMFGGVKEKNRHNVIIQLRQCREGGRFMTYVHGCLGQCREAGRFMTDVTTMYICHEPACFTELS
jgi:hypothetical protein